MINVTMSGNEDMSVTMSGDEEISASMTETVVVVEKDHNELNNRNIANQHPMSAITGLVDALDDKADIEDIPTKTSDLTNDSGFITSVAWTDILNKPQTFTPSAHTHTKSEITDFPVIPTVPTKLSGFQDDLGSNPVHTHSQYLTEHQSLSGYATQSWVEGKGYLTEHQSLSGYATQTWVGQQGFLTAHQDVSGKEDKTNKTTSLSASSTDTQYPSAKCVYDKISQLNEDLEDKVEYTDKLSSMTGSMTEAEKNTVWSRQSIIKATMDSVAVAGAQYYLGEQSSVAITM